ncbi:MAG: carbohydrate kinase family protein [Desulfurococcales archaeon]|nr:carbohydrate kinase family protein [Desulfurococcales archaeon]
MAQKTLDVVAVGHALVDIRMLVDKFPGPDEEAEIIRETRGSGGSAVNVSIDVARLGGRSGIIAKIGFDSFGRIVYEELWKERVLLRGLRISPDMRTGFSIVTIDSGGNIALYSFKGAAEHLQPEDLDAELIGQAKILHIASLRLDTSIRAAMIAKEKGTMVSWDPGRRIAGLGLESVRQLLALTDIVFLNRNEAKLLTGKPPEEAARIIASTGPKFVIVKLGPEGSLLYIAETGEYVRIPAHKPERVVDTTGAGDAYAAGTLLKLARGASIREAAEYGSLIASRKIANLGAHSI